MGHLLFSPLGRALARFLSKPLDGTSMATSPPDLLQRALQPCDVLLIEGNTRISSAIKFLTQSTWSHAALYVGPQPSLPLHDGEVVSLIEADLNEGIRAVSLSAYAHMHVRICRPVGLSAEERNSVMAYAADRLGQHYDLKNVFDLARYVLRTPPVPTPWRRKMLALGSGDPTRAICSTLIAQAFQTVRYPILPEITQEQLDDPSCHHCVREQLHIRHHSLYVPRDFDVSPFFAVIKPRLENGFDPHVLNWAKDEEATAESAATHSSPAMAA